VLARYGPKGKRYNMITHKISQYNMIRYKSDTVVAALHAAYCAVLDPMWKKFFTPDPARHGTWHHSFRRTKTDVTPAIFLRVFDVRLWRISKSHRREQHSIRKTSGTTVQHTMTRDFVAGGRCDIGRRRMSSPNFVTLSCVFSRLWCVWKTQRATP